MHTDENATYRAMSDVGTRETPEGVSLPADEETSKMARDTLSTKTSAEHLLCKTPKDSSIGSMMKSKNFNATLILGISQTVFGFLMAVFGVLVILHNANLSQLGAGLWGGFLAMSTGITGVFAAANEWCPLKSTAQKVAHTAFLALSLLSLAISQLVVVFAATGLERDLDDARVDAKDDAPPPAPAPGTVTVTLPANYMGLFSNIGLLVVSILECILATVASYKSAKVLCTCFRPDEDYDDDVVLSSRHAMVSSWLGSHESSPQALYLVAAPASTLGKGSKLSSTVFVAPPPPPPQPASLLGYPLIPAPLGTIPPPPPAREIYIHRQRCPSTRRSRRHVYRECQRHRKRKTDEGISEEEVVKSYTGLDKTIAEEFIDICDSRNTSLYSDSSTAEANNGDTDEYLVDKNVNLCDK